MQNFLAYCRIQIDNKLDWNKNISTVAARGQSKLAFLNRNLKGCPKKLRDTAYISLIRPALEYSCSVWHPHKKSNKDQIEKVQRGAARFVSNNFRRKASVSEMLHDLGWQSLDGRRQGQRLVLFYKIINGLASVETEDWFCNQQDSFTNMIADGTAWCLMCQFRLK